MCYRDIMVKELKINCRVDFISALDPTRGHINPTHIFISRSFKNHLIIILPPAPLRFLNNMTSDGKLNFVQMQGIRTRYYTCCCSSFALNVKQLSYTILPTDVH